MQTTANTIAEQAQQILSQVRKVIVGKDQTLLWVLAAMLSGGHILLEDIPGVGKTTMAVAFSKVLGLSCNRVQFTPDVLPSDVTGYSVLDPKTGAMTYQNGAVLCNIFLADELNRATSRTQSALLEAMEEGQVTVDGVSHPLPKPFIVIATQNPTGAAGTQLLPDSQMDRFAMRMSLGYPGIADEITMVTQRHQGTPMDSLQPIMDPGALMAMQKEVAATYISDEVVEYAVRLIAATRSSEDILRGASPRATLCVVNTARAIAQLRGRDYVIPRDIQEAFLKTIPHRLLPDANAEAAGKTMEQLLKQCLASVVAPKLR